MNKTEFVRRMAENASISQADADKIIDTFRTIMVDALKAKPQLSLSDFGAPMVVSKAELMGRGLRKNAPLIIREANVLGRFRR